MKTGCREIRTLLLDFVRGELDDVGQESVRMHIDACPDCRAELGETVSLLDAVREGSRVEPSPDFAARVTARARTELEQEGASTRVRALLAKPRKNLSEQGAVLRAFLRHRVRNAPVWVAAVAVHAAAVLLLTFLYLPYQVGPKGATEIGIDLPLSKLTEAETKKIWDDASPISDPGAPHGAGEDVMVPDDVTDNPWKNPSHRPTPGPRPPVGIEGFPIESTKRLSRQFGQVAAWFESRLSDKLKNERMMRHDSLALRPILKETLDFLASRQAVDGGFRLEAARPPHLYRVGVSALALLAFLGDGNGLSHGPYSEVVNRGADYLLNHQDTESGRIGPARGNYMYNHGIATAALLECIGMEKALRTPAKRLETLRAAAHRAVSFLLSCRNRSGAFGYNAVEEAGDTSVTAWQLYALELAKGLGIIDYRLRKGYDEALDGIRSWFAEMTDAQGRVGYRRGNAVKTYPESMTAVGLYCARPASSSSEIVEKQIALVSGKAPGTHKRDFYFWYYASHALFSAVREKLAEAKVFGRWNASMKKTLGSLQKEDGGFPARTSYGDIGGRVYTSALAALVMEVYYRRG
jgi:hypothetical protein